MRTHATQSDRNVLITGAARRIGSEIAIGLAKEGFNIAIHCNQSTSEANELKKTIEETGVSATVISANLSDADSAKKSLTRRIVRSVQSATSSTTHRYFLMTAQRPRVGKTLMHTCE